MNGVSLIEGRIMTDHIHMYVSIPPKLSVSVFMAYLNGKNSLMVFDHHQEYVTKHGSKHFLPEDISAQSWEVECGNYHKYISEQEVNDRLDG